MSKAKCENDIVYGLSEISLYLSNIGKDDFAQTIEDACKRLSMLEEQESEYEKGFNDAMEDKQELMYEGIDGKWHKKDW